jgi:hypothetical protein
VKVLICGSRDWTDRGTIRRWLEKLPPKSLVVHGAAPGADTIADEEARALGHITYPYPADWKNLGKKAGPIRNQRMLDENPDVDAVLAFTWVVEGTQGVTRGTGDMVIRALAAGIRVTIVPPTRLTMQSQGGCPVSDDFTPRRERDRATLLEGLQAAEDATWTGSEFARSRLRRLLGMPLDAPASDEDRVIKPPTRTPTELLELRRRAVERAEINIRRENEERYRRRT